MRLYLALWLTLSYLLSQTRSRPRKTSTTTSTLRSESSKRATSPTLSTHPPLPPPPRTTTTLLLHRSCRQSQDRRVRRCQRAQSRSASEGPSRGLVRADRTQREKWSNEAERDWTSCGGRNDSRESEEEGDAKFGSNRGRTVDPWAEAACMSAGDQGTGEDPHYTTYKANSIISQRSSMKIYLFEIIAPHLTPRGS